MCERAWTLPGLTNLHRWAELGNTILVKALDRHPVRLPHGQRAQLQRRPLVREALIGLVQLRWRDSPPDIVTHGAAHGLPRDHRVTLIGLALRAQPRRC